MKIGNQFMDVGLGLALGSFAQAAQPVWTLTPNVAYPPQRSITPTESIMVQYTVQNQSHKTHQLKMLPIEGISASGCEQSLKYKQTCVLSLNITGSALKKNVVGGPVLCQVSGGTPNPNQCYQPSFADSLHIIQNEEPVLSTFTAVGYYTDGSNVLPLSYVSNDGGNSRVVNTTFTEPDSLNGEWTVRSISCMTSNHCVTVGAYESSDASTTVAVAYTSNNRGKNWSLGGVFPLVSGGSDYVLNGTSCVNNGNCMTVGEYYFSSTRHPLGYSSADSGQHWALMSFSLLSAEEHVLESVSCVGNHCVAVGFYDVGGVSKPLIYRSSNLGGSWMNVTIPGANGSLASVSCVANYCASMGSMEQLASIAYVSQDFGEHWVSATMPSSPPNFSGLASVACTSSGKCVAMGFKESSGQAIPLSYVSNDYGNHWVNSSTQPPAHVLATNGLELGVSCKEDGSCVSAGTDTALFLPFSYVSADFGNNWVESTINPPSQALGTLIAGIN